jgi:hypothetical protein
MTLAIKMKAIITMIGFLVLIFGGCQHKDGFLVKSYDQQSGKLILLRYRTKSTITASCLITRDMQSDKNGDVFDQICLQLPSHVGEVIKEGKKKNEIDKTIALYFHLDDTNNQTEVWKVENEQTE